MRRRGDGRDEGDNIPIVFSMSDQSEPQVSMGGGAAAADPPQSKKAKEMESEIKSQDLGACGFSAEDPPSYLEATKSQKRSSGYEQLIID